MTLLEKIKGNLIVSCQAEEGFPLNSPHHLAAFAATTVMGGAVAIRASNPEVEALIALDIDMIALDATQRPRPDGRTLEQLVLAIRERSDILLMADVSNLEEGIKAEALGFDAIGTTLSGYTNYTLERSGVDIPLIRELTQAVNVPIIAEGRINTPNDVRVALEAGAYAVVVGSMITRPHMITERFVASTKKYDKSECVVAVDIGGTKIAVGIVDAQGEILLRKQVATPVVGGGPAIVHEVVQDIEALLSEYKGKQPTTIGISTGGQINKQGEIVGGTDMLPDWIGYPLKATIANHFNLPTTVLNDGHAANLAEAKYGAGQGYNSLLCIVIGTGLGGGLAYNGCIQHGANGLAGSIGQIKISLDAETYMPLESLVSGPALAILYNNKASNRVADARDVAERASAGDTIALDVIRRLGEWLGLGLSHALHSLDVDCVVIAGSVAQIGMPLFEATRQSLAAKGHSTIAQTPIIPAKYRSDAGLVGAAVYALSKLRS